MALNRLVYIAYNQILSDKSALLSDKSAQYEILACFTLLQRVGLFVRITQIQNVLKLRKVYIRIRYPQGLNLNPSKSETIR